MSLIDSSYFTGPLNIPQLGQASVDENLQYFIDREEPTFLQAALGYELWQDFIEGLSQPTIDPIWLALRDGRDFQGSGLWPPFIWQNGYMNYRRDWFIPQNPARRRHWVGFLGAAPSGGSGNNSFGPILVLTVDATTMAGGQVIQGPVSSTDTYTLAALAGSSYTIERRGYGTMTAQDVEVTNNGQTITLLQFGDVFTAGAVFILHFDTVQGAGVPVTAYPSPLAGHVYYRYFRDQAANLSAFGVVSTDGENSVRVNGMLKMADAFNRASNDILTLWAYLDLQTQAGNPVVYQSYDRLKINYEYFKPINQFGI